MSDGTCHELDCARTTELSPARLTTEFDRRTVDRQRQDFRIRPDRPFEAAHCQAAIGLRVRAAEKRLQFGHE